MSQTQQRPRFIAVEDTPPVPAAADTAAAEQHAEAVQKWLYLAFRALSMRAATAITNLFSLILVALVAALLGRILDDPTPNRLAGVGGFAVFCLLIDIVRRRSK
jgi:hypothetical protein